MFNGTIPAELRSFEHEHAKQWKVSETWSACSGNLTTEHVLREAGVTVLHSNDVTLYSCMVGGYFAGTPLRTSSGPPNRSPGDSCFPGKRGVGGAWRMRVLVRGWGVTHARAAASSEAPSDELV